MPTPTSGLSQSVKRKRTSSEKGPSKRARSESSESSEEEDSQAQIILLADEILKSKKNYNNITKLIQILGAEGDEADDSVVAAISLCRVFTSLMVSGDMVRKQGTTEKDAVVIKWLKERYSEYKAGLLLLLGEEGVSSTVLDLCMRLLKTEGQHFRGQEYSFPTTFLTDMVRVFLDPKNDGSVREEFSETYVEEYDDIRFYTLEALELVLVPLPKYCSDSSIGKFWLKPSRKHFLKTLFRCLLLLNPSQNQKKNWKIFGFQRQRKLHTPCTLLHNTRSARKMLGYP